jgi:hypothetical protein
MSARRTITQVELDADMSDAIMSGADMRGDW